MHAKIRSMHAKIRSWWADESGQGISEYAMLVAIVAALTVASIELLDISISVLFANIGTYITGKSPV